VVKPSVAEEISVTLEDPAAALAIPSADLPPVAEARPVACRLDVGCATSAGRARQRNEDSFLAQQLSWCNLDRRHDLALIVVADGLGGHEAGHRASGMVTRFIGDALAPLLHQALAGQTADVAPARLAEAIGHALREANQAVHQRGREEPACRGMAATAAVVLVWDGRVQVGLVGDCRVYHHRAGTLTQVTRDQTLAERMVDLGQLTPQEALTHPARSEVTQAIGFRADLAPATHELALSPGDWLLVACDGLHTQVEPAALQEAVNKTAPSAAALAEHLVELANEAGGMDNCTVAVVRCF
jgi:protein phosphatase